MAIIYSYPEKITPADDDFLVITDSEQTAPNKNRTKSLKIENLADYIVSSTSGITGSGTLNTIAMFTPNGQRIGDSIITYDNTTIPTITIGPQPSRFEVQGDIIVDNRAVFSGPYARFSGIIEDGSNSAGTAGQVLSSTGSGVQWIDNTAPGTVTGSGATDFVPKFTDGPNGVIGDSFIKSYVFAPGTGNEENRVEIDPTPLSNPNVLIVNTGRFTTVETDSIIASNTGFVRLYGNVNIGNASADMLDIVSTTNIYNAPIKAGPLPFGDLAPGADYVLASDASSTLNWTSQDSYVSGAIAKLIPTIIVATPGGSSTFSTDHNIVELQWVGGNGTYVLNIPSATAIPYRVIRFAIDGSFPGGGSHNIDITAQAGETIDGNSSFTLNRTYEGAAIWSNGTEWIVIQLKG